MSANRSNNNTATIFDTVESRRQHLISLVQSLIRIRSEDPPGDNADICSYLESVLRQEGFETKVVGISRAYPNLIASWSSGRAGPHIVFNGHMETLPVGERARWDRDPFGGELADGCIHGRGAQCMKGGLGAMIEAARAIIPYSTSICGRITLVLVSDEVNGGARGTKYVLETVPETRGDVALVGEGGTGIGFGHKGPLFVEFRATGDGGHGAYGFAHASANHRLLAFLEDLRRLERERTPRDFPIRKEIERNRIFIDERNGKGATDALFRLTVNVGAIRGGNKVNTIAEEAVAEVDFRLPPGTTAEGILAEIDDLLLRHQDIARRVIWANNPTNSPTGHSWMQTLRRNSARVFTEAMPFGFTNGFTDCRFFQLRGIPAAAIGLRGANVGAPNEYIEADHLVKTAKLFAISAVEYLSRSS